MTLLSRHSPGAPAPVARPVRILQIGGGVFLRGFLDWMVDVANARGAYDGAVAVALSTGRRFADEIAVQDMLYTVLVRGEQDGAPMVERRIIGAIADAFGLAEDWDRALAIARSPALEVVVSNTTEAGIADAEQPFAPGRPPSGFPARLAALLHARFEALGPEGGDLLVLPCELIVDNGPTLRRIVGAHGARWGFGDGFARWLDARVRFRSTLVDRIVAGFPKADAPALFAEWGYEDPLAVTAEPFHLWAIEANGASEAAASDRARLPLAEAGLGVIWTDDLRPWRESKVRVLNGGHTASALAAFLAGHDTVGEMVGDPVFAGALRRTIDDEILPSVPLPDDERRRYAARVLERFANPFNRHELLSISVGSIGKWRIRLLPSLRDAVARDGTAPPGLAFSLAALIRFDRAYGRDGDGFVGRRDAGPYPIRDDAASLARLDAFWRAHGDDAAALVGAVLAARDLWGEDLRDLPGLERETTRHLASILHDGTRAALQRLVRGTFS